MRENIKCYACVWFKQCDKELEEKCKERDYILYATQKDKELCDIMCGGD